jgi:hypothetical protein
VKAVVCTGYGAPDVLELRQVEKPVPKDHEVLIKVQATTVHRGDVRIRSFDVPRGRWTRAPRRGRLAAGPFRVLEKMPFTKAGECFNHGKIKNYHFGSMGGFNADLPFR